MKLRDLERHLEAQGCEKVREGARHGCPGRSCDAGHDLTGSVWLWLRSARGEHDRPDNVAAAEERTLKLAA